MGRYERSDTKKALRDAIKRHGFRRRSSTPDPGDSCYSELWEPQFSGGPLLSCVFTWMKDSFLLDIICFDHHEAAQLLDDSVRLVQDSLEPGWTFRREPKLITMINVDEIVVCTVRRLHANPRAVRVSGLLPSVS